MPQILESVWVKKWLQVGRIETSSWPIHSLIWDFLIYSSPWKAEPSFSRPKNHPKIRYGLRDMSILPNLCHKAQKSQLRTILAFNIKVAKIT